MNDELLLTFTNLYGKRKGIATYFAPARLNLIGDHIDYNGGHVLPCSITLGTYATIRLRKDKRLNFYSMNNSQDGVIHASLDNLTSIRDGGWVDYLLGVIWSYTQRGIDIPCGMDMAIWGNVPQAVGLASSASLGALMAYILNDAFGFLLSGQDMAMICQYAENNFKGIDCGSMDHFAVFMGKKDQAIYLDTATLKYEYVPIEFRDLKIIVTDTMTKHEMAEIIAAKRRMECSRALESIQTRISCDALGDLSIDEFEEYRDSIVDDKIFHRGKHAVYENQRTIKAKKALAEGNIEKFGMLMNESHASLRDDYETSCMECDILVEAAWSVDGVIGSRITGAGCGGCIVSLVRADALETFVKTLTAVYEDKVHMTPAFFVVETCDGPCRIL